MVKTVAFLLPPDKGMASIHVRARCLIGHQPKGWHFKFIEGPEQSAGVGGIERFTRFLIYLMNLSRIRCQKNDLSFYFIKPSSIILLVFCRWILRSPVFIDINDPLHLPEHMGRFACFKFRLMLKISNGAVFESEEYHTYCAPWLQIPTTIIEDTPQFEKIYDNFDKRVMGVVWFGSPATSIVLESYMPHLVKFDKCGLKIVLVGASSEVVARVKAEICSVVNIEKYDHRQLVDILSGMIAAFVPMPFGASFELRGNLKAKLAMAAGCITIASDLPMHRRLISHGNNGYIFDDEEAFSKICDEIKVAPPLRASKLGRAANLHVMANFNRSAHANAISKFIESVV
jgi:hypothetical protein